MHPSVHFFDDIVPDVVHLKVSPVGRQQSTVYLGEDPLDDLLALGPPELHHVSRHPVSFLGVAAFLDDGLYDLRFLASTASYLLHGVLNLLDEEVF